MEAVREAAKPVIRFLFWNHVAAEATVCGLAMLGVWKALTVGNTDVAGFYAGRAAAGLFAFWLVGWIARDARRSAERLRLEREARAAATAAELDKAEPAANPAAEPLA
ncbi:MAG: hypothetical protein AAGA92_14930 [Planctomycetota bacterium]